MISPSPALPPALAPLTSLPRRALWRTVSLLASIACIVGAGLLSSNAAEAADYPERPVKVVVAFAPGGIADQAARAIGDGLGQVLGQPVVIENRGGAGGNIGASTAARATPDGYTVLVTTTSVAVNPALYANPGYDLGRELLPVTEIATSANVVAAHPGYGVRTLPEAIAKARGAKASFGSPGNGSTSHLTGEYLFNSVSNAGVAHVPYRGGALAVADTLGGQTPFVVVPIPVVAQHVKAGTLVPLAVTGTTRYADWPEVPTVAESGFPGYQDATWVGAFVPAGTPAAIVETLNRKIVEVLGQPAVRSRLAAAGLEARGTSSAAFADYVRDEAARWKSVVEKTGVKGE